MASASNDLFRFVSLRRPDHGLSVDPSEVASGSVALRLLADLRVDIDNPRQEVLARLEQVPLLTEDAVAGLALGRVTDAIYSPAAATWSVLANLHVQLDGRGVPLLSIARAAFFPDEYRRAFDTWLVRELRRERGALSATLARLLRGGYLAHRLATATGELRTPGLIGDLLQARLELPKAWRAAHYRQADVARRHAEVLPRRAEVGPSARDQHLQALKERHAGLIKLIKQRELIQKRVHTQYFAMLRSERGPLAGSPPPAPARRTVPLSDAFYDQVKTHLTVDQRAILAELLEHTPGGRPVDFNELVDIVSAEVQIEEANETCAEIHAVEDDDGDSLPVVQPSGEQPERPLVGAIGWGDLVVARERLVGYTAREVAHIENILAGETKLREHERVNKTEQVEEVETISEKESEKDSQTTDRYELQSQSQEAIEQDFSIATGINTSGRYGLTHVDTSLDTAFEQSRSQSHSSSMSTAREIVSRAVERTFERVRQLRRLTVTEQIRELNRHELANTSGDGTTPPQSGIYLWVEKIHEVELRHYGTRMMIEFHVPEPALSLFEQGPRSKPARRLPPFSIGPQHVNAGNYICLAQRFGAQDIVPPPVQFINVGFTWASTPSEQAEQWAEDALSDTIAVPDGYRPVSGTAIASMLRESGPEDPFDVYVAVGGITVIDEADEGGFARRDFELLPATPWPAGVPVSGRAKGHFDKTMVIQVMIRCERVPEALSKWALRTWEQLRTGYEALSRRMERELQQLGLQQSLFGAIEGRPDAEMRRIERAELAKWAIKAMRLKPFNFNAVERVGGMQEISPLDADMQAPIVRFFEEAFDWDQMSYFLYPYFWSRRDSWAMRNRATSLDPRFRAFLNAGAARVIVAVTPGYEAKVLSYLESDPELDELARIRAPVGDDVPAGTSFEDLWLELLTDRKEDLGLGSGTLAVQHGARSVHINDDSNWDASERDLGRELYVGGDRYLVHAVSGPRDLELDRAYAAETDAGARYATGSVPFGPPWLVNVPTSLVLLADNRAALESLVSPG